MTGTVTAANDPNHLLGGQNGGGRRGEQGRPWVTDAATGPRVRHRGQITPQVSGCLQQGWAGGFPQLLEA
ncbi:hypothetical protein [Streptomyces adustus]|uniref:hypothetical protein n=1 Tax=Streptomyces adustus TaxID=1609272 RepID=UPI0012E001C4|nr:hypothetical protein [Streptomyces adustus]